MDSLLITQLDPVFRQVETPVALVDANGCLLQNKTFPLPPIPAQIPPRTPYEAGGYTFFTFELGTRLCLIGMNGAKDTLMLLHRLIESTAYAIRRDHDDASAYRALLRGEIIQSKMDSFCQAFQLNRRTERALLLFQMASYPSGAISDLVQNVVPFSEQDLYIRIDAHAAAIVRGTGNNLGELIEYAKAASETLLSEEAVSVRIGISETINDLMLVPQAFRQAEHAILIGSAYDSSETIFPYSLMRYERVLAAVPKEDAQYFHALLFNKKTQRVLNREMLDTISAFLASDLNLSDTARKLFIHRNTLVYRLDKIQKQLGLDLRCFRDAVTFKLLLDLQNNGHL